MPTKVAKRSRSTPPGERLYDIFKKKPAPKKPKASSPSPSPSVQSDEVAENAKQPEKPKEKLRVSIDYGTKTLAVAFVIVKPEQSYSPANIHNVHFGQDYWAPQQAAWDKDGNFLWGYEVDEAENRGQITADQILELWKLMLYKDHTTSDDAKRVRQQLGKRSIDLLLTVHFRAIMNAVRAYVKTHIPTLKDVTKETIDRMDRELFLSAPQMWKPPANERMIRAAKIAGVEHVELVYEPQSAAAFYTYSIRDKVPQHLHVGDVLLVADIGGGTGDFVSFGYRDLSDKGASVRLEVAKPPQGALCGSQFVTKNFVAWFKTKNKINGRWPALCDQLGLSDAAACRQASTAFESIKQRFTVRDTQPSYVTLRGMHGAKRKQWGTPVTCKEIATFFEPVVKQIIQCIEAQYTERTKAMIIPGGFGRSPYLLGRLKERYPKLEILGQASDIVGAYQPVSRGSLYRYKDIQERSWPSTGSFGVGQVEIYDENHHPDATIFHKRSDQTWPDPAKVIEDDFNSKIKVVYERWVPILEKGQALEPGKTFASSIWQMYYVRLDDTTISTQIYWTDIPIKRHDPIVTGKHVNDPGSVLRGGIEHWGRKLTMDVPDLEALGFEVKVTREEEEVYEIYYRLRLTCRGANVNVNWQIALPGTQPYDKNGNARDSEVQLTANQIFEVNSASHNCNARGSEGL